MTPHRSGRAWIPRAGTRVGSYEIVSELGRGGMGVVYRAFDSQLGRDVALKLVLSDKLTSQRLTRFEREGSVTALLDHPGIVKIHAAGRHEGRPYLAYELIEDVRSWEDVQAELSLEQRAGLVRDAARALGVAHAGGVTHRDVKPANLLIDGDGRVKVADFGLALATEAERLTRTGALVGTPSHMAPEQFMGGQVSVGPPSDVWALGVILYEALTGRLPFEATRLIELAAEIAEAAPPSPRSVDPDIPSGLEAVCLRSLRRDPAARYAHGEELAADLDRALAGEPLQAQRRPRRALWLGLALFAAACLLVAGLVVTVGGRRTSARQALEDHARWEREEFAAYAYALGGGQLSVASLEERAQRLEAAARHLTGSEALAAGRALADMQAVQEWVAHEAGAALDMPSAAGDRSVVQLTVDALVLLGLGKDRASLRRIERAVAQDPASVATGCARLEILAACDPERFLRELIELPTDSALRTFGQARALEVVRAQLKLHLSPASQPPGSDADLAELGALGTRAQALGLPLEELGQLKAQALEEGAARWGQLIRDTRTEAAFQPLLARLETLVVDTPAARPGPRLQEEIRLILGELVEEFEGARDSSKEVADRARTRFLRLDEFRTYVFGTPWEAGGALARLLDGAVRVWDFSVTPEVTFGVLRWGGAHRVQALVNNLTPKDVLELRRHHPQSRAARLCGLLLEAGAVHNPLLRAGHLAELEQLFEAGPPDLAPGYVGEAHLYAVEILALPSFVGSLSPAERRELGEQVRAHALAARELVTLPSLLTDSYVAEADALDLLGRGEDALGLWDTAVAVFEARLERAGDTPDTDEGVAEDLHELASVLSRRGFAREGRREWEQAEADYRRALRVQSRTGRGSAAAAREGLAGVLRQQGRMKEGVELLLAAFPGQFRSGALTLKTARWLEALRDPRLGDFLEQAVRTSVDRRSASDQATLVEMLERSRSQGE